MVLNNTLCRGRWCGQLNVMKRHPKALIKHHFKIRIEKVFLASFKQKAEILSHKKSKHYKTLCLVKRQMNWIIVVLNYLSSKLPDSTQTIYRLQINVNVQRGSHNIL